MPPRQQQRLTADLAGELAECDHRTREGDGTDEDAEVDLDEVDGLGRTLVDHGGVDIARESDQAGGEADQAVHQGDELGHLGHLHGARGVEADRAADDQRADDPGQALGEFDARPEDRGQHGERHAHHAEQVAAARGLGVRETAEAQDEEDGSAQVGDGGEVFGEHACGSLTCGTSRACDA